jgi:hypothetical protein
MSVAYISPAGKFRAVDNNGNALVGGKVYTYSAGTTTPIQTFTDSTAITLNANPVILNSRGEADIWILPNTGYKFILQDSNGNVIWTEDNIFLSQLLTLYGGVDTGSANNYVINFAGNFTSLADGIYIIWFPSNANTSASVINVNGFGNVSILNPDGTNISAGQIVAGQPAYILYKAGNWVLCASGLSPAYQTGSFTMSLTGCTTIPTQTCFYVRIGNQVTLNVPFAITGTSNTTLATLTGIPAAITPVSWGYSFVIPVWNNTTLNPGSLQITPSGTSLFTLPGTGFGSFTAAGTKGVGAFTVTYFLL